MTLIATIRQTLSRNALTHRLFVEVASRSSMRLFALQRFLSVNELRAKWRAFIWRQCVRLSDRADVEKVEIKNGAATFYYRDGCAFHADPGRSSLSSVQFSHGEYESGETRLMARVVSENSTVVDAGANFGWHAIHLARAVGASGKVFAFEPIPQSLQELQKNQRLNGCDNLETVGVALGNAESSVVFYLPSIHLGSGAASQFLDTGTRTEVQMRKLDDFLEERRVTRVDFIKADVEGGELNLLRGAEQLLRRCRPSILVENVDVHCWRFGHTPVDVIQFLQDLGYHGSYVNDQGELSPYDEKRPPNGNLYFTAAR